MPNGYDILLDDGHFDVKLKFADSQIGRAMRDLSATPSTLYITGGERKFGDWDPDFSHIGQRDWSGGRAQDDFFDDPTKYYDTNAWTSTKGKILPALQWQISEGLRDVDQSLPGDLSWHNLGYGEPRLLETSFVAGQNYDADKVYLWIKRTGSPASLYFELTADDAGDPGTVLQTKIITASDIPDITSVFKVFDFTGTESLVNGTTYHIVIIGAVGADAASHWSVGVDESGTDGQIPDYLAPAVTSSTEVASWTSSSNSMYYRVVDADVDAEWHPFFLGTTMYIVSQPASGTSVLKVWNESTDKFDDVSVTGDALAGIVTSVAVARGVVYMARGSGNTIWAFRKDGATYEGDNHLDTYADLVYATKEYIWRSELGTNNKVSVAKANAWTKWDTELSFGPDIPCGKPITAIAEHNNLIYVRTQTHLGKIVDDVYETIEGLDAVFETGSTNALASQNYGLYFSWSHSVERLIEGTLDDIGPWKGTGLPSDRVGVVSTILPVIGWQFWAVNAGTGTSSVLVYNDIGINEVFRAPEAGQEIKALAWQPVADAQPRLWISCGCDMYYINFPQDTLNPSRDTTVNYMHESYIEFSSIDMGAAELKKLFHELTLIATNLDDEVRVEVDVQTDEKIGETGYTNWKYKGEFITSPTDTININEGDSKAIRIRLRLITNDADVPPDVTSTILKAIARTPERRQLTFTVDVREFQVSKQGAPDKLPSTIMDALSAMSKNMRVVRMRTDIHEYKDVPVVIDTITPRRETLSQGGETGGTLSFTARVLI